MWASLLLLALAEPASAGSCCAGTTTGTPFRVAEGEVAVAGLDLSLDHTLGRWDHAGRATTSSLRQSGLGLGLGAGLRLGPSLQGTARLPLKANLRRVGEEATLAGGLADLEVALLWRPIEEQWAPAGTAGAAVPAFTLGTRLPTGRDWRASVDPLQADVTGQPGVGLLGALGMERTLGERPFSLSVDAQVVPGPFEVPAVFGLSGSLGQAFGPDFTLMGSAALSLSPGGARSTRVGARLVHGRQRAWRGWVGAGLDVPLHGFGRDMPRGVGLELGFVGVR